LCSFALESFRSAPKIRQATAPMAGCLITFAAPFRASLPRPLTLSRWHQGAKVYGHLALAPALPRFFEPPHPPVPRTGPLSFCSLRAQTCLFAFWQLPGILFEGRVRPLSVEDGAPQHPLIQVKTLYRRELSGGPIRELIGRMPNSVTSKYWI